MGKMLVGKGGVIQSYTKKILLRVSVLRRSHIAVNDSNLEQRVLRRLLTKKGEGGVVPEHYRA